MLCSFAHPYRQLASIRCIPLGVKRSRCLANKVSGRELDGPNGNVLRNIVMHTATPSLTKISYEDRKAAQLKKQTDALKRYIPKPALSKPIYGKPKAEVLKTKDMKFKTLYEVNKFILEDLPKCTPRNIADMMNISVKVAKKDKKISLLKVHLPVIASRLKGFYPDELCFRDISTIVYGLQCHSEDDAGVMDILSTMSDMAGQCVSNNQPLKSQDVSMLLLGLQPMGGGREEIRKLLTVITAMVIGCTDHFDEQNIGNALYGLQNMGSDSAEVRALLAAVTIKVKESPSELSSQSVGNALFGLQGMNSDCLEVRQLLSALAVKILDFRPELSAQALSNSLYGLQGMSSDHSEVRDVLSALVVKANHSRRTLTSKEIGTALYGLHGTSSDRIEVRELLSSMSVKLKYCQEPLTGRALCDALYGLQNMTYVQPDSMEAKVLLSEVISRIVSCEDRMSGRDVAYAIYGLQGVRGVVGDVEYIAALRVMFERVTRIIYGDDGIVPQLDTIALKSLLLLHESISLILTEIKKVLKQNHYMSWEKVNRQLADEVTSRRRNGCDHYDEREFEYEAEKRMKMTITRVLNRRNNDRENSRENSNIMVRSNDYLFDLFKSDFILRIPVDNLLNKEEKSILTFNIEVDGSYHGNNGGNGITGGNKNRIYCTRKDQYLSSKGVIVTRIESASVLSMSEGGLEEWVLNSIRSARAKHSVSIIGLSDAVNIINAL